MYQAGVACNLCTISLVHHAILQAITMHFCVKQMHTELVGQSGLMQVQGVHTAQVAQGGVTQHADLVALHR